MEPHKDIHNLTAYVDGELNAVEEQLIVKKQIETSSDYRFEYESQCCVKELLRERFSSYKAPGYLRERIKHECQTHTANVKSTQQAKLKKESLFDMIIERLFRPVPAMLFIVVVAFTLLYVNVMRPNGTRFMFDRESGEYNMVHRAKINFAKILSGELKPESFEVEPMRIKEFFKNKGVKYETVIPECNYWKILGSVVSDCKGEKLAHTVYTSPDGELMYLFQVDEEHFHKYNTLDISPDLEKMLANEKYLKFTESDTCIFMWKKGNKIFTLLSNGNYETIENDFLARLM